MPPTDRRALRKWITIAAMLIGTLLGPFCFPCRCQESSHALPESVYGSWVIKSVYKTHNVTGLNGAAERRLIGSHLRFTQGSVESCGASASIATVESKDVTEEEFFAGVYVRFKDVGVTTKTIDEVLVNGGEAGDCNGTGTLPGEHFFIKGRNEILIQYEGAFFRALKEVAS